MAWDKLLSSINLGPISARNRIVFRPLRTNLADRGRISPALVAFYQERAKGGCGTIVVGELTLHPGDRPYDKMIEVYAPEAVTELRMLTDSVKSEGALVFAQLNHRGFQSHGAVSRRAVWGPTALADVVHGEVCRKMEAEEIRVVTEAFIEGALRVKEAGFDGLEVSIGSDSLLRQFLSPLTNTRDDEYGGTPDNRLKFPLEILGSVRKAVGEAFPIGVRLCMDEMFYGAMTSEEAIPAAQEIERQGLVDFFTTTVGTYYNLYQVQASTHHPVGLTLDKVAELKAGVSCPVAAGNRIKGPDLAESVLAENKADLIAWGRFLICDPDIPNKLEAGRAEDILPCVYDNDGCLGRTARDRTIGCIQNPWAGREGQRASIQIVSPAQVKKVVIVGAGPAGLEAACVAARRGHNVVLFEGEEEPGGQLRLAVKQPGRSELKEVLDSRIRRLEKLKVSVQYGRIMDAESVLAEAPDAVIIATGSSPKSRPVPGDYGPPEVLNVRHVFENAYPIGARVLLVDEDGHHKATATAEYLADQERSVDMITSEPFIGLDLAANGDLYNTRQRLLTRGVRLICNQVVTEIGKHSVTTMDKFTGEINTFDGYDTIVTAMLQTPDDQLYRSLKGIISELYRAGDAVAPRRIQAAIFEGHHAGLRI